MFVQIVWGALGLVLLALGADQLIVGAGRIARRLRVTPVAVGVVVIGLGTSVPELMVSTVAARHGQPDLAVGNLVGSNIVNMTVVLGIGGLITPVAVASSVLRREAPLAVAAVALFALLLAVGLGTVAGWVLVGVLMAALALLLRFARAAGGGDPLAGQVRGFLDEPRPTALGPEAARTVGALATTVVGAQLLTDSAARLATGLGVSQALIGFTVLALGTSLPELVTTIGAQRRGEADLLVGNLLGSSLFNSLAGGAVTALAAADPSAPGIGGWSPAAMTAITLVAWALLARGHRLTRPESAVLLALYAATVPLLG